MFRTFKKLYKLTLSFQKHRLFLLLIAAVLTSFCEALGLSLIIPAFKAVTDPSWFAALSVVSTAKEISGLDEDWLLAVFLALMLLIFIIKNGFMIAVNKAICSYSWATAVNLGERVLDATLRQPFERILAEGETATMIRDNRETVLAVCFNGISGALSTIAEGIVIVAILTLLLVFEPLGTVTAILLFMIYFKGVHRFISRHLRWLGVERLDASRDTLKNLGHLAATLKDIKLHGSESYFKDLLVGSLGREAHAWRGERFFALITGRITEMAMIVIVIVVITVLVLTAEDASEALSQLGLFVAAATRLVPSFGRFNQGTNLINLSRASIDRMDAMLFEYSPDAVTRYDPDLLALPLTECLNLEKVSFGYPASEHGHVLNDISLEIKKGEFIALVGPSGAGKSTLADVLLGLLRPAEGEFKVDGLDIWPAPQAWRKSVGYVPQQIFILNDSLRRNVAFGQADDAIDEERVWAVLRAAQLDDFVKRLPDGTNTSVGEGGFGTSGGERQRIGIARALYHDPALLVLDEPTSQLDTQTEQAVMSAILKLRGKRTLVVIAHRLSTVARSDRLYLLKAGRIVDSGSFAELRDRSPVFAEMLEQGHLQNQVDGELPATSG